MNLVFIKNKFLKLIQIISKSIAWMSNLLYKILVLVTKNLMIIKQLALMNIFDLRLLNNNYSAIFTHNYCVSNHDKEKHCIARRWLFR